MAFCFAAKIIIFAIKKNSEKIFDLGKKHLHLAWKKIN